MNKKLLIILVLLVGILLVLIGVFFYINSQTSVNTIISDSEIKTKPLKIIAFGDSLVAGYGATSGNDFISDLSRMSDEPILNLGVSGNTTAQGLARISSVTDEIQPENKTVVLLLLGGNDFLQQVDQKTTFANLEEIITTLQDDGAEVLLLGVRGGLYSDVYASDFQKLANKTKVKFVPNVLDGLIGNNALMSDTVHPNNVGYEKIAEKVFPVLQDVIK